MSSIYVIYIYIPEIRAFKYKGQPKKLGYGWRFAHTRQPNPCQLSFIGWETDSQTVVNLVFSWLENTDKAELAWVWLSGVNR